MVSVRATSGDIRVRAAGDTVSVFLGGEGEVAQQPVGDNALADMMLFQRGGIEGVLQDKGVGEQGREASGSTAVAISEAHRMGRSLSVMQRQKNRKC